MPLDRFARLVLTTELYSASGGDHHDLAIHCTHDDYWHDYHWNGGRTLPYISEIWRADKTARPHAWRNRHTDWPLLIIAALYAADLILMHVLPQITSKPDTMAYMMALHLNWGWLAALGTAGMMIRCLNG